MLDPRARSLGCAGCGACCEEIVLGWDPRESPTEFVREHWTVEWVEDKGPRDSRGSQPWGQVGYVVTCDAYDPVHKRCTAHEDRPDVCRGYPWYDNHPTRGALPDRKQLVDPDTGAVTPYGCSYALDAPGWSAQGVRPLIPVTVISG